MADFTDYGGQENALAEAYKQALLRKKTEIPTGTFHDRYGFVPAGLGNQIMAVGEQFLGGREAEKAQAQMLALRQQQGQEVQRLGQELTNPPMVPGEVMPEGIAGPPQAERAMSPVELSNYRLPRAMQLAQMPMGKEIGMDVLKREFAFPETMAKQQETQQAKEAIELQRIEAQHQRDLDRAQTQKDRDAADQKFQMMLAQYRGGIQVHIAGMPARSTGENKEEETYGKLQAGYRWKNPDDKSQGVVPITGTATETKAAAGPKLTSFQEKTNDAMTALQARIDRAAEAVKDRPESFNVKTMATHLPLVGQYALNRADPEGVEHRNAVAGLSAQQIKEISGAAVSGQELARLTSYATVPGDTAEDIKRKINGFQAELKAIRDARYKNWGYTPPGGVPEPVQFKDVPSIGTKKPLVVTKPPATPTGPSDEELLKKYGR